LCNSEQNVSRIVIFGEDKSTSSARTHLRLGFHNFGLLGLMFGISASPMHCSAAALNDAPEEESFQRVLQCHWKKRAFNEKKRAGACSAAEVCFERRPFV